MNFVFQFFFNHVLIFHFTAVLKSRRDILKEAIRLKADVNVRDHSGHTAVDYAIQQNDKEVLSVLLEAEGLELYHSSPSGVNLVDILDDEDAPASLREKISSLVTKSLVNYVYYAMADKLSSLLNALADNVSYFLSVELLVQCCKSLNAKECLLVLFRHGLEVFMFTQSAEGFFPISYAFKLRNYDIVEELIKKGNKFVILTQAHFDSHFNMTPRKPQLANLLSHPKEVFDISKEVLSTLSEIDLSNCELSVVPPGIEALVLLKKLDISKNKIQEIPTFLAEFKVLKEAKFSGNPLSRVPDSIKKNINKFDQLKQYLQDLKGKKDVWNSVKLVVLGKEGVGKTHLLKSLRNEKKHENVSTDGVQVGDITLKSINFRCYDFAGQV